MAATAASGSISQAQKRARSWEVDISLEELVSWDVLEQFMQEIPGGSGDSLGVGLQSEPALGQAAADSLGSQATSSYGNTSDPLLIRGIDTTSTGLSISLSGVGQPSLWDSVGDSSRSGVLHDRPSLLDNASGSSSGACCVGNGGSGSCRGGCMDALSLGLQRPNGLNAASLAQSLYPNWTGLATSAPSMHPGQTLLGGVSWSSELLPNALGPNDGDHAIFGSSSPDPGIDIGLGPDTSVSGGRPVHKTRFVWTAELHRRFEAAVNTLGIDHAKPQAISQLMNCEGEGAPTRQNIKSHLQKYRLLMQKRARQGPGPMTSGADGSGEFGDSKRADASCEDMSSHQQEPTDAQSQLEQHLARQEMNLKVQMELQTKLHRQLLVQRQLQHQLDHSLNSPADLDGPDKQRWRATMLLKNNLRERLTKHVMMQQEMLHHLDALVSSEVSKPFASGEEKAEGQVATPAASSNSAAAESGIPNMAEAEPSSETAEAVKSEPAGLQ